MLKDRGHCKRGPGACACCSAGRENWIGEGPTRPDPEPDGAMALSDSWHAGGSDGAARGSISRSLPFTLAEVTGGSKNEFPAVSRDGEGRGTSLGEWKEA